MNDDQHTRVDNAIGEEMDIEHKSGNTYRVKDKYDVDPVNKTCECPDHEYRGYICKHLHRVNIELFLENIEQPDDGNEVTRPNPLEPLYERVPDSLQAMEQWVCWVNQRDDNPDHEKDWTKVPIDVTSGGYASSTDSDTWTTFEEARHYDADAETERTDGIGICVSEDDDLIGIDIDDCRDPDSGELVAGVADLIEKIGSYTEVSPSGTGLRVFVRGEWPVGSNQTDAIAGKGVELEVYEWGRYLTVTGYHVDGTPKDVTDDEDTIDLFAEIMDPSYGLEVEETDA